MARVRRGPRVSSRSSGRAARGATSTDAVTGFFADLSSRGHQPLLEKGTGTLRFDLVDGNRVERWLITLDKGDVSVSRRNAAADCVLRTERALFGAIVTGNADAVSAYLRGEVTLEGNPELMVLFRRVLPVRAKRRRSVARRERR
jgi:putative sterol carrier protein